MRILCSLSARGCFLSKELIGRLGAFLKRCYRYGFASKIEHVDTLFANACMDLFHRIIYAPQVTVCMKFCHLLLDSVMIRVRVLMMMMIMIDYINVRPKADA